MHEKAERLHRLIDPQLEEMKAKLDWARNMKEKGPDKLLTINSHELYGLIEGSLTNEIAAYESLLSNSDELFTLRDLVRQFAKEAPHLIELAHEVREMSKSRAQEPSPDAGDMMKIAMEVNQDYWSDTSNPPKQEYLIAEIMRKYHVSEAKAKAIEAVACPLDRSKKVR